MIVSLRLEESVDFLYVACMNFRIVCHAYRQWCLVHVSDMVFSPQEEPISSKDAKKVSDYVGVKVEFKK